MSRSRKNTKRFTFEGSRNSTSHKAGANVVTISSREYDTSGPGYTAGTDTPTSVTMTVKEAQALNRFLNRFLDTPNS
jgi:hypothetical protein